MKIAFSFVRAITYGISLAMALLGGRMARATEYTVEMTSDWTFLPSYLEIHVGDIVTWVNHDYTLNLHNAYCPGYFNTGLLDVDETASFLFLAPATYNYEDSNFYVLGMTGTLVVLPAINATNSPPQLVDPGQLPGGAFQFTVSNLVAGATYVIQASTDFSNWSGIATNVAGSSAETFVDNAAAGINRRFYRALVH
jgi:plastocyanin